MFATDAIRLTAYRVAVYYLPGWVDGSGRCVCGVTDWIHHLPDDVYGIPAWVDCLPDYC